MLRRERSRPAAIVPLTAVCLIVLLAFVALAIDLGMVMIARNQCQNAADAAAMAGARTLNGDPTTDNNYANVEPNARAAAAANNVLNTPVDPVTQLTTTIGDYYYDSTLGAFQMNPTGRQPGNNWTLVQSTVTATPPATFSQVLGLGALNVRARATAAHRPRDVAIIIDFSGSMRFESMLGYPHTGARTASMNPDSVYPTWGHYAGNSSLLTYAGDKQLSSGEVIAIGNVSVPTSLSPDAVISKFYADTTAFGTTTPAFTKAPDAYASAPGGDVPLKANKGSGSSYANSVSHHVYNNTSSTGRDWRFELDGHAAYSGGAVNASTDDAPDYTDVPFHGYTQGPGYWGKTFFNWPPDPRVPLNTTYFTSTQVQSLVQQFLGDFGYTTADFNNTSVKTTLSASVTTTATTIRVTSATAFPPAPFQVMVGTLSGSAFSTGSSIEIMNVTAVSGTTWTVQRARDGTAAAAFSSGRAVGLLTGPPLYGIYNAASASVSPRGRTPTTANLWTNWASAADLGYYLTSSVYLPGNKARLATTDPQYLQLLRLYNRVGPGMPKDGAGTPVPADWRMRFFLTTAGAPLTDNSRLYDTSGNLRVPRSDSSNNYYRINYDAILDWIKTCGPNPFPNQLRAGGIVYYTAIPSTIDVNTFPPTDPNQRFWKEYIDEVLGLRQTGGSGSTPVYSNVASRNGYGDDFVWGSASVSGVPSGWPTTNYITYTNRPERPKLRTWFGPLSLIDFIGNYNAADASNNNNARLWWPGTVPEAPTYQTKLAIQAVLKDVALNHPNDNVSLIFFSSPRESATDTGYYNTARAPLSRDPRRGINSLFFSPKVIDTNAEISVYNSSGVNPGDIYDVPRANGSTCYAMPLMLAYNQFSANPGLVNYTANAAPGTAGGLGRNGAAKMLVFETDGVVNTGASAPLVSSTTGQGYYRVRLADANNLGAGGSEFPTGVSSVTFGTGASQSQTIASQICADLTAGGFSTARKPVKIHCIAFGSLFDPSNTSSSKTNALSNLASLEVIGKVQQAGATTLSPNKIIVGDYTTRVSRLQAAFSGIMQDGVQVTLIASGAGQP